MKVYLSHGGGVNSWALYLWLTEQGEVPGKDFEAVFVDHGTDWPETYAYMDMMIGRGYPVTVIGVEVEGCRSVYDWYRLKKHGFPSRLPGLRWCTTKFKVEPVKQYYKTPCIELIGFDADERKRAKSMVGKTGVEQEYPLIDAGIDRQGCIDIIERHGLPMPPKSGCYICPFQSRGQWIELRRDHPDLFCRAVELEKMANERRSSEGKSPAYFYAGVPLKLIIQPKMNGLIVREEQPLLFDPDFDRPCRCVSQMISRHNKMLRRRIQQWKKN